VSDGGERLRPSRRALVAGVGAATALAAAGGPARAARTIGQAALPPSGGLRVDIGGLRLFVDFEGPKLVPDGPEMREKPSLILLHGGPGGDHSAFRPAFSRLSDICHIVYYDHRGQGRSDRGDPAGWTLAQWADDLVALCDALDISKPIVLGHSFGGQVAQAYAIRHPDHPAKLILSSTQARFEIDRSAAKFAELGHPECGELLREVWAESDGALMARYIADCIPRYNRRPPPDPDAEARTVPSREVTMHYYRPGGEAQTADFLPELDRVACPTLVLAGEADPITPVANARDMAKAISRAPVRLETLSGAGHRLFSEAPDRYFALLRAFILA